MSRSNLLHAQLDASEPGVAPVDRLLDARSATIRVEFALALDRGNLVGQILVFDRVADPG